MEKVHVSQGTLTEFAACCLLGKHRQLNPRFRYQRDTCNIRHAKVGLEEREETEIKSNMFQSYRSVKKQDKTTVACLFAYRW